MLELLVIDGHKALKGFYPNSLPQFATVQYTLTHIDDTHMCGTYVGAADPLTLHPSTSTMVVIVIAKTDATLNGTLLTCYCCHHHHHDNEPVIVEPFQPPNTLMQIHARTHRTYNGHKFML